MNPGAMLGHLPSWSSFAVFDGTHINSFSAVTPDAVQQLIRTAEG
jgi:hypothetical protein